MLRDAPRTLKTSSLAVTSKDAVSVFADCSAVIEQSGGMHPVLSIAAKSKLWVEGVAYSLSSSSYIPQCAPIPAVLCCWPARLRELHSSLPFSWPQGLPPPPLAPLAPLAPLFPPVLPFSWPHGPQGRTLLTPTPTPTPTYTLPMGPFLWPHGLPPPPLAPLAPLRTLLTPTPTPTPHTPCPWVPSDGPMGCRPLRLHRLLDSSPPFLGTLNPRPKAQSA